MSYPPNRHRRRHCLPIGLIAMIGLAMICTSAQAEPVSPTGAQPAKEKPADSKDAAAETTAEPEQDARPEQDGSASGLQNMTDQTVAGKTLQDCEKALADKNRVARLRAARTLVVFGDQAATALTRALDHDDAAVRFLAATSLGQLGGKSLEDAESKLIDMAETQAGSNETKSAPPEQPLSVRMAAAYALCEAGNEEQYLPILVDALSFPERGIACYSADLIGRLGPQASAATDALEAVYAKHKPGVKGGDYHVGGAAMNALRKIRNE